MLIALTIENFVLVKRLELDLKSGMTAFTGETGAGKSIMIDALMLALGARADSSFIRTNSEKCDIHAVFHIDEGSEPWQWLMDEEIACQDGEVVLKRVLYLEGRSKSCINGQPVPLQKLREFGEMLVHIHGQHQHQTLLQHAYHRQQLDRYAKHDDLLAEVANAYKQSQKIKQELQKLQNQETHKDKLALLQFQLDELHALNLQEGEVQVLNEEHQRLHHANDYLQRTEEIKHLLSSEDNPDICNQINQVIHMLQGLPCQQKQVANMMELMQNALIQCEEAQHEIESFAEQLRLDPERLLDIESRLSTLHRAARKHQVELKQLFTHTQTLENEFHHLQNIDKQIAILEKQYQENVELYEKAALNLSQSRKEHAIQLGEEISIIIKQLGMPKGFVRLDLSPLEKGQIHGIDKVEYKVSTNPGLPADALSKIASGGELSRISLAIQMITAERGATPTLLFDEVDVGIGGATAALVGRLLRNLGERLQIFCVTHQPQVASSAHHHFVVEKFSDNEQTYSQINAVKDEEKIDEIARMLGGLTITEQTRSHAKELLEQCH